MEPTIHNHVFSRIWDQVTGSFDREVEQARNGQGSRAIKFRTEGLHRALVREVNSRPGFEVQLCDWPEIPGLVSETGIVTFAEPLPTSSLELLIRLIDRWVVAVETVYGEVGDGTEPSPIPSDFGNCQLAVVQAVNSSPAASDATTTADEQSPASHNQANGGQQ